MKYKDGKRKVRIDDPVWIIKSDGSLSGSGTIIGFNDEGNFCNVECGGKIYEEITSKEITYWK